MSRAVVVTVLVENTTFGRHVRAEHGLSFWIESDEKKILFDTGQTPDILRANADHLGIDLRSADAVVLSHGHYDHTGGLDMVLDLTAGADLYLHPAALERRYSRAKSGDVSEVGIPKGHDEETLLRRTASLTFTREATCLGSGFWVTGPVPRITSFEDTGGDFFLDEACAHSDPIEDDQAVYFPTDQGTVVLLGCAHAGLVNTLSFVKTKTGGAPLTAVMGGTHLVSASPERMDSTMKAVAGMGLQMIAPMHCTGARAQTRFATEFPEAWEPIHVGSRFEFLMPASLAPA